MPDERKGRHAQAVFSGCRGSTVFDPEAQTRRELAEVKREPRVRAKNDPKLVAAARELRDRWMEEVNSGRYLPASLGKYEVSRGIAVRDQRSAIGSETAALLLITSAHCDGPIRRVSGSSGSPNGFKR